MIIKKTLRQFLILTSVVLFSIIVVSSCKKDTAKKQSLLSQDQQQTLTFSVSDTTYKINGALVDNPNFGCTLKRDIEGSDTLYALNGVYNDKTYISIVMHVSSLSEGTFKGPNYIRGSSDVEARINDKYNTTSMSDTLSTTTITITSIQDNLASGTFSAVLGKNAPSTKITNGEFHNVLIVNE